MSLSHRYRNFGGSKASAEPTSEAASETNEDQQLQAFEKGYQAGWDDAVKAQADSIAKVSAEFGQNLPRSDIGAEKLSIKHRAKRASL